MKGVCIALLLLAFACGPPPKADSPWDHDLSPLPQGAEWDYRVVDDQGRVSARAVRVVGQAPLDGQDAILVDSTENGVVTRSWLRNASLVLVLQRRVNGAVQSFDPGEPWGPDSSDVSTGQTFSAEWVAGSDHLSETWTVEDTHENVTTEAGTFKAVRVRRERSDGTSEHLWFAPGVGLLKTDGGAERLTLLVFAFP